MIDRERVIEHGLRKQIERMGGRALKFTSPGNSGVPDRIAILPGGRVWFIELKTKNGKTSAIQDWQIKQLRDQGCNVAVIKSQQEAIDWCLARQSDPEQIDHEAREYAAEYEKAMEEFRR